MSGRHLIAIRHLDRPDIEALLAKAKEFRSRVLAGKPVDAMANCVLGMLFFENSTRTRMSFEQAAYYLGMKTAHFASSMSSMNKGETLKDTVLTLRYERLDGLVMRHKLSGAATLAARYFGGPVLNAGDGQHEHPTQALADALTIIDRKGGLEDLAVAIVGDIEHSRVARSNAWLLSKMGAEVRFVGPKVLIPKETGRLPGKVYYNLAEGLHGADVIICLRLQTERMNDGLMSSVTEYSQLYQVNRETLRYAKKDCLVMHPGPINRGIEIDDVAADSERSAISAQVENGIFVRMAALDWVFTDLQPALPVEKGAREPSKAKAKITGGSK